MPDLRLTPVHLKPVALLAVVALLTSLGVMGAGPASAADTVSWGASGITSTDSAATVRWDNAGNAETSVVPRDASQVIPFTNGKTYADVRKSINDIYATDFSDLAMTVSQTRDLRNQAVSLTFTGLPANGNTPSKYLEVFQCWGAPGEDGTPDPSATTPDPRTCVEGAGGADYIDTSLVPSRSLQGDRLLVSGSDASKRAEMPLLSVSGAETAGVDYEKEFNRTSTNELSYVRNPSGGVSQRTFELHTGAESSFLGCGERADAPSSSRCWLVAVPVSRAATGAPLNMAGGGAPSGLTPSLWAQRMQVAMDFAPAAETCPNGQARILAAGSEVATLAMRSWIPGLCADAGIASGYSQLSDDQARRQLDTGAANLVYTSGAASAEAVYAPAALAGVAIGLTVDYNPILCNQRPQDACDGGDDYPDVYPDRETYLREAALAGSPIHDIRLDARLVAKLLTQSYGVDNTGAAYGLFKSAPFLQDRLGWSLLLDPEFVRLNPQLKYHRGFGSADSLKKLEVESLRSDAASAMWSWITSDPEASAFLNGCPDPDGMVINPWFSTRTYAGCERESKTLEKAAAVERDATEVPGTFDRKSKPNYTTLTAAYPQVLYAETLASEAAPGTMVDLYPPLSDHAATARAGLRATDQRGAWCTPDVGGCLPSQWKSRATSKHLLGARESAVITDTGSAARYQLATASLCDSGGTACVAADRQSLTRQADRFAVEGAGSIATAPETPDYVGGSYPLTLLVSAAVGTRGLRPSAAKPIADSLEYLATRGQVEGTNSGNLLPGFAPLTPRLVWQSSQAVAALRAIPEPVTAAQPGRGSIAPPPAAPAAAPPAFVPKTVTPPATTVTVPAPGAPKPTAAPLAGARTGATEVGDPRLGLILGLGGALVAAILVPIFGRSRRAEAE